MSYFKAIWGLLKDIIRLLTGIGSGRWYSKYIAMVFGGLSTALGGMVVGFLQFMGLTLAINTIATPVVLPYIVGPLTGLPIEWQNFLALAHIDRAVTILVSAMGFVVARQIRFKPSNPSLWS